MKVQKNILDALIPCEKALPKMPDAWDDVDNLGNKHRVSQDVLAYNTESGEFDICTCSEVKLDNLPSYFYWTDKAEQEVTITHWMPLYEE